MQLDPPLLVFAHCFGGSARSWAPLLQELGGGEHVAPDLPGFGGTALRAMPSLTCYANYFAGLAGGRRWIAVGHSMGGKIAMAVATRQPPELIGLILIASSPPTPEPISDADRQASLDGFNSKRSSHRRLSAIAERLSPAMLAACVEDESRVTEATWRWWLERGSRVDISATVNGLELPTLVVSGDDDKALGPETAPAIARAIPNAVHSIIPNAGHLLPQEQPRAVSQLIRTFVAELAPVLT